MFYRSMNLCIPQNFPLKPSLNEIEQYLIQQRQGQDLKLSPFVLQRLGDSRLNQRIGIFDYVSGISQEQIPTARILPSREDLMYTSEQSLCVKTWGNIMFPNTQEVHSSRYEGLSVSTIILGRVIEDLDCPFETYYDSEVASLLEGDVWGIGSAWQSLCLCELKPILLYPTNAREPWKIRRSLKTEGIKTYRSMLSIKDTVPEFLESSEKKDLARWVSRRKAGKAAFIITAYQTYINAIIEDDVMPRRSEQPLGRLLLKIYGFRQKAISDEGGKCSHHFEITMNL